MSIFSDLGLIKKRSKNRSRLEIVRDMLCAASEKTKKTNIMYQASLSYRLLEKYLESLLESGLLECVNNSFYLITWRGKEFLQTYDDYIQWCNRLRKEITSARKEKSFLENMCLNNKLNPKQTESEEDVSV